jgi:hypothetical protein
VDARDRPGRHRGGAVQARHAHEVRGYAALFGTAFALDAVGDLACLPAGAGRTTCVMSYAATTGQRCLRAASVPRAVIARSRALGPAVCQSS